MSDWQHEAIKLGNKVKMMREALSAAKGYLLNARFDLEVGVPKKTAIRTIEGGIRAVDEALADTAEGTQ